MSRVISAAWRTGELPSLPSLYNQSNIHNLIKVPLPNTQDKGEFYTSVYLKVGRQKHKEDAEPREQQSWCLQSRSFDHGS